MIMRSGTLSWSGEGAGREAFVSGLATLFCLTLLALALQQGTDLPPWFTATAAGAFLLVLPVLIYLLPGHHPHRRFGNANRVTMVRSACAALLLGYVGPHTDASLAWWVVAVAAVAASLDAVDGRLARRQGTASAFGARFDMEADAALVLILSVLVWQFEKAGIWILAAGLMRYAFLLSGLFLPWMRRRVRPSVRRQAVCVAQVVVLIVCLAPPVPLSWSTPLAALGLAVLAWSFLVDVRWLVANSHRRNSATMATIEETLE